MTLSNRNAIILFALNLVENVNGCARSYSSKDMLDTHEEIWWRSKSLITMNDAKSIKERQS
jgi:hypothetical protein